MELATQPRTSPNGHHGLTSSNIHKRRCPNFPFKHFPSILAPIDNDLATLIREEFHRRANDSHMNRNDPPTLSIRQTQIICEKLVKNRENKLREEYDRILINKLAEQHETFVKYTHDHIQTRYNETHQASYLS